MTDIVAEFEGIFGRITATERKWLTDHIGSVKANADVALSEENDRLIARIAELEKLVYVPGQWRCAKCNFRLTQSNLYVESGTVGPRDEPGDKCPNCDGPLWRVSAMEDRNEAYRTANEMFDRLEASKCGTGGWQSIDTAPKDGTRVIVALFGWALPRHRAMELAAIDFFDDSLPREYQCFFACTGYWSDKWQSWTDGIDQLREPSHWMPVPEVQAAAINIHQRGTDG
jgi:uncharacterized protein with PIN domain